MMRKYIFSLLLAAIICTPVSLSAQITIGSGAAPREFSVLELISNDAQGLRLPQMTMDERIVLVGTQEFIDKKTTLARGLMIFNTSSECVEIWNGEDWISSCGPCYDPCKGFEIMDRRFCAGETIAELTARAIAAGGSSAVQWFDAAGNELPSTHVLEDGVTYYADNCAGATARIPVTVSIESCVPINSDAGRLFAFVNTMYDFQHQQLGASTVSGGAATSWQWQMRVGTSGSWIDIPNAPSAPNFTIPENFMYDVAGIPIGYLGQAPDNPDILFNGERTNAVEIFFRCILSNLVSDNIITNELGILFIRTNTSGFGRDANGVRYLVMNRAPQVAPHPETDNTIRLALLNLGQSGTGAWRNSVRVDLGTPQDDSSNYNDAGDFGDLYQWGRIADGHQHIVWNRSGGMVRSVLPMTGNGATSLHVRPPTTPLIRDANGQIPPSNTNFFGKFIEPAHPHNAGNPYHRWGDGNLTSNTFMNNWGRPNVLREINSISDWDFPANNPCPPGWRVPSSFEWIDMLHGTGGADMTHDIRPAQLNLPLTGTYSKNTWRWRAPVTLSHQQTSRPTLTVRSPRGEYAYFVHTRLRDANGVVGWDLTVYWASDGRHDSHWRAAVGGAMQFNTTGSTAGNIQGFGVSHMRVFAGGPVRCVQQSKIRIFRINGLAGLFFLLIH